MSGYQKMVGYVVDHRAGSIAIDGISTDLDIDGVLWNIPCPMIEVVHNVVITPQATVIDGNIVFRLDKWEIVQRTPMVRLPFVAHSQTAAVRVINAFRADPAVSFGDSPEALLAWANAYIATRRGVL